MRETLHAERRRSLSKWRFMIGIFIIMIASFVMALPEPSRGESRLATEPSLAAQFSRSSILPGEILVLWSPTGTTSTGPFRNTAKLKSTSGRIIELERSWFRRPSQFESWFWQAVKINEPAGDYQVMMGDMAIGNLTIIRAPASRKWKRFAPGVTEATINNHFASGGNVDLGAGLHIFQQPIIMVPGSELRGYGATVAGKTENEYQNGIIRLADGCTVSGITFQPVNAAFNGQHKGSDRQHINTVTNATVIDCKFTSGQFGIFQQPGLVVDRCVFDRATVSHANQGVWRNCEFRDIGEFEHAFKAVNASGLALIECAFHETDRGPILIQAVEKSLFAGIRCYNLTRINNGGEVCCIEGKGGAGVNDNLFFGWRTNNCPAPFQPFDIDFSRNLVCDFKLHRGSIVFWGDGNQENNLVVDCELDGGGVVFNRPPHSGAINNKLVRVACLNFKLDSATQPSGDPDYYTRPNWPNLAVIGDYSSKVNAPPNTYKDITIKGAPSDRRSFYNVKAAP